ncbi:hypothetical protein O4G76_15480 [Limimaricola sp. G21655-S1]|uniref:hypothetical protein n=1 Tax=Limimaricola sp. G21655-S1 TaxID=3014768 RepID=UPI0022AF94EA|nr:hypothetical protein [Limimaricola sp. G21655-S1]MCZ4262242.1 hypothetical protein [Limimaricola sp. G21655-S1]
MAMLMDQDQILDAYFLKSGMGELRHSGKTRTHFLASGGTTGGAFALIDETARRGETVPLHRHAADIESLYVIEGELSIFLECLPCRSDTAGAFAHFALGAIHGFRVESETARFLLLTTPHHGEFYRAISRVPNEAEDPDEPMDQAVIMAACRDYDVEFVGPFPAAATT